jgi:lipopolysaccharide export system protein LptA
MIVITAYTTKNTMEALPGQAGGKAPEYTLIENLDYFHVKDGLPLMSLSALNMKSQGEEIAEFERPVGIYNQHSRNSTIKYHALEGVYRKVKDSLVLVGDVKVNNEEATYEADKLRYLLKKDLVFGSGHVRFNGKDPKTGDEFKINSEKMKARPNLKQSEFTGAVNGVLQKKRKYEAPLKFRSQLLTFDGIQSYAHLEGDVFMNKEAMRATGGKADIYLENYNKSLKYFVMNDDVKLTETLRNPQTGVLEERKAFAERLEGFGREEKMILTGAPRVEMGKDVIKGYRITVREGTDLVEVDDAMSDMEMKKKEKKAKE